MEKRNKFMEAFIEKYKNGLSSEVSKRLLNYKIEAIKILSDKYQSDREVRSSILESFKKEGITVFTTSYLFEFVKNYEEESNLKFNQMP